MTQLDVEKIAVSGVFHDQSQATRAVDTLRSQGYTENDVTVVAEPQEANEPGEVSDKTVTKSYKGMGIGLAIGLVLGGLLGLLFSNNVLPLPEIALVQLLGPFTLTLLGAMAGAAFGILGGSMIGLGFARQETKGLEKAVEGGRWVVSLRHSDPTAARQALQAAGATTVTMQTSEVETIKQNA